MIYFDVEIHRYGRLIQSAAVLVGTTVYFASERFFLDFVESVIRDLLRAMDSLTDACALCLLVMFGLV